jgi:hypothetical protein
MASCACCEGTQYDPLDVQPCGHDPPGPEGFGKGKGSPSAGAVAISNAAVAAVNVFIGLVCGARAFSSRRQIGHKLLAGTPLGRCRRSPLKSLDYCRCPVATVER